MSRAQRRTEDRLRRSRNNKIVRFKKQHKTKDIKAEISEFFTDLIEYTLYGPGKIFLAIIALCLVVMAAMFLNKARAHLVIGMDSKFEELSTELNEVMEQAETTEVSETTDKDYEYESIIPEETREKAEKKQRKME